MADREADRADEFTVFVEHVEPRLRQALVSVCGTERARDAVADGLAYAWQHWDRVRAMDNPAGYVYRVARSRTRLRRTRTVFPEVAGDVRDVEPALPGALARLPERQRVAVLLVHGWDWRHEDVAELMGVSVSTVRNHLARGLDKLRTELGVPAHG